MCNVLLDNDGTDKVFKKTCSTDTHAKDLVSSIICCGELIPLDWSIASYVIIFTIVCVVDLFLIFAIP